MRFSDIIIPVIFILILLAGIRRRTDTFSAFVSGARSGVQTSFQIIPTLIALMTCIGMLRASGAVEMLCAVIGPLTEKIGLPAEILPLALIRPLSGSGALSVCRQILSEHGPDSTVGRIASVLQGSSETTFYTISLYYGSIGVSRTRHAVPASLTGDIVCCLLSCWIVQIIF